MSSWENTTTLGFRIAIGDINGDNISDLVISSDTRVFPGDSLRGTLDIYNGKSQWTFSKNGYDQRLEAMKTGTSILPWFNLIDVNNDGRMDIACTGDRLINTVFFYGRSDSIRWTPDFVIPSPDTNLYRFFPYAIDVGDVNMDGVRDFVVHGPTTGGAGACLFVYLGNSNPVPKQVGIGCFGFVGSDALWNIAGVGDVNGDGVNDFAATVPREYNENSKDGYFVIFSGNRSFTGVEGEASIPEQPTLSQNYPNPFNPQTTIEFTISRRGHVLLVVYDSLGKEVKRLLDQEMNAGSHRAIWDGTNNKGEKVSSGSYYYRIVKDGKKTEAKQLIFLK